MTKRMKLIWDFRGPDAEQIAKHHVIHINEYVANKSLQNTKVENVKLNDFYSVAVITVDENDLDQTQLNLRPHRTIEDED